MAPASRVALLLLAASLLVACAATPQNVTTAAMVENLSLEELGEQLQTCPIVRELDAAKLAHHEAQPTSPTARLFGLLFPSSRPAVNALLATLYISGPPNFLLALCPTDIDPSSLSVMVAFAVGGLLGDTLFHLLPEIFLGEDDDERTRFVLVEPNRNLLLGLGILVGFMTFVAMDKGLRIATGGGSGHDHGGHGHSHTHARGEEKEGAGAAAATGADTASGQAKSRKKKAGQAVEPRGAKGEDREAVNPSVKLGGYLNLIADFTHNITDGLAMSASFYASPTVGATTTMAVFFHEIPHEVGDFALLVQSGFSKRAAMASQFVTAVGALLGTLIGIAVQELGGGGGGDGEAKMGRNAGIWGTSLSWGDMLLPFTAGTFLYVGTVAVIPELLETGPNKALELRKTLVQFAAVAVGAGVMLYISWHD
ncbi:ZIP zinc transporter [Hirsutella rhossiliensis]|uniref:ZIP zinc transporter domain-containing protein n=1 Tax=Hirsutella rhossiliensis TaxID=111463 RepID=A0A9P8N269_9HYPO|nr:ZIP zinc transporter domain-containing protein [Hirsutella rhossiliensis]KAH0964556.1 ZIP zinc transporter domain-containing protein [Hirsutella rhossiliensis]